MGDRAEILEDELLDNIYFVGLAVLLAFGSLQATGTVLDTQKPVVSVISTSMCPEIQVGDILFVQGVDYSQIEKGDVIVYNVPARAELRIDGKTYVLENNGTQNARVSTPLGRIELVEVIPSPGMNRDRVILEINGSRRLPDSGRGPFIEGTTYEFRNLHMTVRYATDLPIENTPIVHQVVRKDSDSLETIGIANSRQLEFEDHVQPSQIHGKMLFKIPRLGLAKLYLLDLLGYYGDRPLAIDSTPSC
ncbi:MAG: signal peptidase I [Candidatus Nanohaloarchaea archaeon]